ncbi:hypothetical protein OC834_003929 [Tilletia horrida]|nr:hypothetical protein OC834_003929 [Tilletia horrida]
MDHDQLAHLLRNAPPFPSRIPQSSARSRTSHGGPSHSLSHASLVTWSSSTSRGSRFPPPPRSTAKLGSHRPPQAGLRSFRSASSLKSTYKMTSKTMSTPSLVKPPDMPTHREHSETESDDARAPAVRFSHDSLHLAQAYADFNNTMDLPQAPFKPMQARPIAIHPPLATPQKFLAALQPYGERPLPTPNGSSEPDAPRSAPFPPTMPAQAHQAHHQEVVVSTTDAIETDANVSPPVAAFFPDATTSRMHPMPATSSPPRPSVTPMANANATPSGSTRSRFREHPELAEPWLRSVPTTPTNKLRFFPHEENRSQPSIISLGDSRSSAEIARDMPGGPRSPFRLLRSHRNQSVSTSSLLTLATSASPLRSAHASPEHRQQKKRNYIMGAKDVMKWMGGRHSSAALTTMSEPRAEAASNERKRRASLSSLSNLFGFGRSPSAEGPSNATFATTQAGPLRNGGSPESPTPKSRFRVWPFQHDDDPFASHKPMTMLPGRKKDEGDKPSFAYRKASEADVFASGTMPKIAKARWSYAKGLPRLSMGSIGVPLRDQRVGTDELPLRGEDSSSRHRLSWLPQFSRPSTSSGAQPTLPRQTNAMQSPASEAAHGSAPADGGRDRKGFVATTTYHERHDAQPVRDASMSGLPRQVSGEVAREPGRWLSSSPKRSPHESSPTMFHGSVATLISEAEYEARLASRIALSGAAPMGDARDEQKKSSTSAVSLRRMKSLCLRSAQSLSSLRHRAKADAPPLPQPQAQPQPPVAPNPLPRPENKWDAARPLHTFGTVHSRTSRVSSVSQIASPDSATMERLMGQSFASLPTPMPSSELDRTQDGMADARGWSLLQTASPLCSPRHQTPRSGVSSLGKWLPGQSGQPSWKVPMELKAATPPDHAHAAKEGAQGKDIAAPPKLAVYNLATSSAAHAWKPDFLRSGTDGPAVADGQRSQLDVSEFGYLIDIEIEDPRLDIFDQLDSIMAASSDFPEPPVRAEDTAALMGQSGWAPLNCECQAWDTLQEELN